jgi:hypothetical protein
MSNERRATRASALLCAALVLGIARDARAYRPFDGTDAGVAELGTFEWELGPVQYYRQAGHDYLIAPSTVFNLGIFRDVEAVVEFQHFVGLRRVPAEARLRLLDTNAFLKWVWARGALQGERGLSAALEAGPLLPELAGDARFGAQAALIVSYAGGLGALHFNDRMLLSRLGNPGLFTGVIAEGPRKLLVRPVAEVFTARELGLGASYSVLGGAIWSQAESLAFDAGLRLAREQRERVLELRLGLTWSPSLWSANPPD